MLRTEKPSSEFEIQENQANVHLASLSNVKRLVVRLNIAAVAKGKYL